MTQRFAPLRFVRRLDRSSAMGSSQSRPSNFTRVHRSASLGSSQSRPSNFTRVHRSTPMGAAALEYSLVNGLVDIIRSLTPQKVVIAQPVRRPAPAPRRAMQGFGSLGDDTDAEPVTSLAQPTLTQPTVVDPTVQWQNDMLAQTKAMVASQLDYAQREVQQKWIQIAATLAIPLAAAAWRALGRALSGRRATRDFE